jgi:NAD(P)H-hydrate epimerase
VEPVVTPEAMAEADRRTIAAGTPEAVLVERAGRAVARHVRRVLGAAYGRRVVVVCGKGNNGADGLVAARVLRARGVRVDVAELAVPFDRAAVERSLRRADLVIDAMYGTGFRGELEGDAAWSARVTAELALPVVAVDIPSGVDGLTGAVSGVAVRAGSTVTFAARKPGLLFEPGRSNAGTVHVADIGIDLGTTIDEIAVLDERDVADALPERPPATHKWAAGVLVVGGSGGMTGAPALASHAALRAGAGIVICGLPGVDAARRASGTEVITRVLPDVDDGALATDAVGALLDGIERFRALALGPGLGSHRATRAAVVELVRTAPIPLVLDADGLNALDGDLDPLVARADAGLATVITPHDGEYRRLAGQPVGDDRIASARSLAERSGAVVLLKGATTVVAPPAADPAPTFLNPTGTSALASAGTGDVLTGVVAAFLARGVPPAQAAAAAAWVHGRAAQELGSGLVAGDVVAALPPTLAAVRRGTQPEDPHAE